MICPLWCLAKISFLHHPAPAWTTVTTGPWKKSSHWPHPLQMLVRHGDELMGSCKTSCLKQPTLDRSDRYMETQRKCRLWDLLLKSPSEHNKIQKVSLKAIAGLGAYTCRHASHEQMFRILQELNWPWLALPAKKSSLWMDLHLSYLSSMNICSHHIISFYIYIYSNNITIRSVIYIYI
jgi:hypothetical protein